MMPFNLTANTFNDEPVLSKADITDEPWKQFKLSAFSVARGERETFGEESYQNAEQAMKHLQAKCEDLKAIYGYEQIYTELQVEEAA